MLTINLLPGQYRKPQSTSLEQLHRSPLGVLIVGFLVGLTLVLGVTVQLRQARAEKLAARFQAIEPQKQSIEALKATVQHLREQEAVYLRLTQDRRRWAKVLNTLSDATPEGVWFTDLSLDQQKGLVVQGAAISRGGEEMVKIGHLVQDLKDDAHVKTIVQEIQIESIKSVQEQEIEVVEFTLTCKLIPQDS